MVFTQHTKPDYVDRRVQTIRALRIFFLYRLLLAMLLGFAFFTGTGPSLLGRSFPDLFGATVVAYLILILLSGSLLLQRRISSDQQVQITLFVDIVIITFLMHASGGISSGLGLLIAVSITIGSLLMRGRLSLLFSALGALAVLTEQMYAQLADHFPTTAYTQGGLLGITFFAVALLSHVLSMRLRETERLARQRGLDLANMAQLNDYIIQQMNTGVLVVDGENRIMMMNETARRQLGLAENAGGKRLDEALPRLVKHLADWQASPGGKPGDFNLGEASRTLRPELIPLGGDKSEGTLLFLEDSARVAEQAQQMKLASLGRFTASIAHEIRNPLGAISHAGQLLAESPALEAPDRRLTEIIRGNSGRVNDIIESILELSRRKAPHPQGLELGEWLKDLVEEFNGDGCKGHHCIELEIGSDSLRVTADPNQLRQVLNNLCDNAVKYGDTGQADFRIRLSVGRSDVSGKPVMTLSDNGPGIAAENRGRIFEPFFTTGAKGTGLGLYISKELCEANRIDLEYSPEPDGGSRFRLQFLA